MLWILTINIFLLPDLQLKMSASQQARMDSLLTLRHIRVSFLDILSFLLLSLYSRILFSYLVNPKALLTLFERSQFIPPFTSSFVTKPTSECLFWSILFHLIVIPVSNVPSSQMKIHIYLLPHLCCFFKYPSSGTFLNHCSLNCINWVCHFWTMTKFTILKILHFAPFFLYLVVTIKVTRCMNFSVI